MKHEAVGCGSTALVTNSDFELQIATAGSTAQGSLDGLHRRLIQNFTQPLAV